MFRRNKPGRGFFGRAGPRKPARASPPMLIQAHRLFSWRQYLPAADLYEKLAEGALTREPSRAPQLFLQAGKALLAGGRVDEGMGRIQRGLEILYSQHRFGELRRTGWRVVRHLENSGLETQANQIHSWLIGLQTSEAIVDWNEEPAPRKNNIRLALSCPACGGVVDPNEVEWVNKDTAECTYCGSLLRGEEA